MFFRLSFIESHSNLVRRRKPTLTATVADLDRRLLRLPQRVEVVHDGLTLVYLQAGGIGIGIGMFIQYIYPILYIVMPTCGKTVFTLEPSRRHGHAKSGERRDKQLRHDFSRQHRGRRKATSRTFSQRHQNARPRRLDRSFSREQSCHSGTCASLSRGALQEVYCIVSQTR